MLSAPANGALRKAFAPGQAKLALVRMAEY